jgi:hypothetical protein
MQNTDNPYDDLTLDYDLLIEMPQMHPKERQKPICFTTLFFNRGRVPTSKQDWEMVQIDAFWLIHIFRCGSCEVNAAFRLFFHGLIHKEEEDPDLYGEAAIALTERGLASVFRSLQDGRIRDNLFPFITPFTELDGLHTEPSEFSPKKLETQRLNYRRTKTVIRREFETPFKLAGLLPKKTPLRQQSGTIQ